MRTTKTHLWRANQAARGVLQRRECITWGLFQIHWKKLDHYNIYHRMRWPELRVLKR